MATAKGRPEQPHLPASPLVARRLLFVGSDPLWFQQAKHDILCLQSHWQCQLAQDGTEAAKLCAGNGFDAMIVETSRVNRLELEKQLPANFGRMICLARCNLSERAAVAHWQTFGATPIAEDSDATVLVAALKRDEQLRTWMSAPEMKKLLPQLKSLPAAPELYVQVSEELRAAAGSMAEVSRLISQDPVMSAKMLQVVNSAFFGLPQEVTDTYEAVMVMGAERVRSLILLAGVFSQYNPSDCPGFSVESVWGHSVQVGTFARTIAITELKDARAAEAAFTAGLLHDIGKIILAANLPQMYATIRRLQASKQIGAVEAELIALGVPVAELSACLLGTWRLPLAILEAIAWHQRPGKAKEKCFSLLTAVHVANALTAEGEKGENLEGDGGVDTDYLMGIGVMDGGNRWRELCGVKPKTSSETLGELVRRRREAKEN